MIFYWLGWIDFEYGSVMAKIDLFGQLRMQGRVDVLLFSYYIFIFLSSGEQQATEEGEGGFWGGDNTGGYGGGNDDGAYGAGAEGDR